MVTIVQNQLLLHRLVTHLVDDIYIIIWIGTFGGEKKEQVLDKF